MKTALSEAVINIILREIEKLCSENLVINKILRTDVFTLLEAQNCTVLYYPVEDEIRGLRIKKYVGDKYEDFVYINTARSESEQVFAAAHELGHLIGIDELVCRELNLKQERKTCEDIIDRFAAELLMERNAFSMHVSGKAQEYLNASGMVTGMDMIRIIVYLMDTFQVPYEAVVRRMYETERIDKTAKDDLLNDIQSMTGILEKIIDEGNYRRLKPTNVKAIGELSKYLKLLEENDLISEKRLANIEKTFDLKDFEENEDVYVGSIRIERENTNEGH